MGNIVTMTEKEIFETFDVEKALEMAKNAPESTEEDMIAEGVYPGGPTIARGFAAFQEYIKNRDHPQVQEPEDSIPHDSLSTQVSPG